jgi:hypothetical protein
MPRFDLRLDDGTLDPLASFKVLAVICHPHNRILREKMLGIIQKESGVGQPRRRPLRPEEFMERVRRADRRAAVAGGLLLTMLQLHHNGYRASLNRAMPLVSTLLPTWKQPEGPYWSTSCHFEHWPHSKSNMLRAYNHFRSVAHFWAALLHGQQHDRQDIWPGSLQTLPTFLAYADVILDMACSMPSWARGRRFATSRSEAWTFTIPQRATPALLGFPLNEEQLAILNEHENRKPLT